MPPKERLSIFRNTVHLPGAIARPIAPVCSMFLLQQGWRSFSSTCRMSIKNIRALHRLTSLHTLRHFGHNTVSSREAALSVTRQAIYQRLADLRTSGVMASVMSKFRMKIYGIDFTSSPSKRKPITCLECELTGSTLTAGTLVEWTNFDGFEETLQKPGLWIAGIDFPFGQARRFIETIGWPETWEGYVKHAADLGREGFVDALNAYRLARASGIKNIRE